MDLISVHCMQIPSVPSNICWTGFHFYIVYFVCLSQKSGIAAWIHIWVFYFVPLNEWSLHVPVIKELQIKTTLRFHQTSVRIATIKNRNNNKCWQECGGKGTLILCWWQCKLVQPLWKTVWRLLKLLNIELPYDPVILLLGIHPKYWKSGYNKGTMFIAALFTIANLRK
jgi:hypothetical protein